jgi:hypothetical protein
MMIRRAMLPARPFQHPHNRLLGGGDLYVGACHGYVGVTYVMWHVCGVASRSSVESHSTFAAHVSAPRVFESTSTAFRLYGAKIR